MLPTIVMEIVAQAINGLNAISPSQPCQLFQRGPAIIRRQELACDRVAGRFFQMQVGNQQGLARRPVKRCFARRFEPDFAE